MPFIPIIDLIYRLAEKTLEPAGLSWSFGQLRFGISPQKPMVIRIGDLSL
jgi:hypothetical protein